jgi:NitT/TauT family transport system substrate-binding protein
MLAQDKGWFADPGVNVDIVRGYGSNDVVTKVAAGTYEAGTGYSANLIRTISENPDLDAVAIVFAYDGDPNALTGVKKEGLVEAKDIAGTTISAVAGSTAEFLFPLYAKAVGIDPGTVTFVNVARPLVPIMVQQGDADLSTGFISTAISNFARLEYSRDELVIFRYSDYLPIYGNALIVRKSWAEAHPDAAKGLASAYIQGLLYTREHPEEAMDVLVAQEPLLEHEIELNDWLIAAENYYFTDNVLEKGLAYHTREDVSNFIDIIVGGFELERTPAVQEIYDPRYLPAIEERMVQP